MSGPDRPPTDPWGSADPWDRAGATATPAADAWGSAQPDATGPPLRPVAVALALPAVEPPARVVGGDDAGWLIAAHDGRVRLWAVDPAGAVRAHRSLPLSAVDGVARAGDDLVVAGRDRDGPAVVTGAVHGDVDVAVPVPTGGDRTAWPVPAGRGGVAVLHWAGARCVHLASVHDTGLARWPSVELAGDVTASDAAVVGTSGETTVVVAAALARDDGLHLTLIVDGEARDSTTVPGVAPGTVRVVGGGSHVLVVVLERGGRRMSAAWFDTRLVPHGDRATIVEAEHAARIHSADVTTGRNGPAVQWRTVAGPPHGHIEIRQAVARVAADTLAIGRARPLAPAGASFHGLGWVGDRLAVVHGHDTAVLSLFAAGS